MKPTIIFFCMKLCLYVLQIAEVTYKSTTVFFDLYLYTLIIYIQVIDISSTLIFLPPYCSQETPICMGFCSFLMILSPCREYLSSKICQQPLLFLKFKQRYLSAVNLVKMSYLYSFVGYHKQKIKS